MHASPFGPTSLPVPGLLLVVPLRYAHFILSNPYNIPGTPMSYYRTLNKGLSNPGNNFACNPHRILPFQSYNNPSCLHITLQFNTSTNTPSNTSTNTTYLLTLTHTLTHSHTHTLTHSHTHSLTHPLTRSLTH